MGIREEQDMGNYTNEKSLIVVQDNFLNKVKKFSNIILFIVLVGTVVS